MKQNNIKKIMMACVITLGVFMGCAKEEKKEDRYLEVEKLSGTAYLFQPSVTDAQKEAYVQSLREQRKNLEIRSLDELKAFQASGPSETQEKARAMAVSLMTVSDIIAQIVPFDLNIIQSNRTARYIGKITMDGSTEEAKTFNYDPVAGTLSFTYVEVDSEGKEISQTLLGSSENISAGFSESLLVTKKLNAAVGEMAEIQHAQFFDGVIVVETKDAEGKPVSTVAGYYTLEKMSKATPDAIHSFLATHETKKGTPVGSQGPFEEEVNAQDKSPQDEGLKAPPGEK